MLETETPWPRNRSEWLRVALLAVLYVVLGRLSFALAVTHGTVTNVVFASEGIALAFALRYGWHVLPGIVLGQTALAWSMSMPAAVAAGIGVVNTLEAALGIWCFRRAGLRIGLPRMRDFVGLFALSAFILQPFSATFGTLTLFAGGVMPAGQWGTLWMAWWTGNVLGQMLFTPLLLTWWAGPSWRPATRRAAIARLLVSVTLALGVLLFVAVFAWRYPLPALAMVYPLVATVAIHWGSRGATLVSTALCLLATALAAQGAPPFNEATVQDRLFLLDLFILSTTLTAMTVAALVTQHRDTESARRSGEERLALALSATQDGVWDWNLLTDEVYYSPRWKQMLGYSDDELENQYTAWERLLHPDDRARVLQAIEQVRHGAESYEVEFRLRHKAGHYVHILSRGRPVRLVDGGPFTRFVGTHFDLTERKLQEAALLAARNDLEARVQVRTRELTAANTALQQEIRQRQHAEERLHAEMERAQITLASIGDGVITTDPQGRIETMNGVAQDLIGLTQAQARGRPFMDVFRAVGESTRLPIEDPVSAVLRTGQIKGFDQSVILLRTDGREIFISDSAAPIRDPANRIVGTVIVFRDVTAQHKLVREVSWQASHDALTGTLNRAEFERRLGLMLEHAHVDGHQHALCYLDLDEFKVVNDTCGHSAGDELLRQITALLRSRLRERDTLARLGGDEFGILLGDCPPEEAVRIAEALRERVQDFRFAWQDKTFSIGVSIGLVPLNGASSDVATVLSQADSACYIAKEHGRNRVHLHEPGDEEMERRRSQIRWVSRLERAREENRLKLFYQPITALNGSAPEGGYGEVLLRFVDEEGELQRPEALIHAAERFHQMQTIDRWVVKTLLATLASNGALARPGRFAVNLSGQSLGNRDFLDFVAAQFDESGVPPSSICFEITETSAIAKLDAANRFISTLRERGCYFALDDFGSGLSSFGYLKSLPVDTIKIDGRFVRHMVADPVDRAMVEAIQRIGHVMGLKTVGECAEDAATLDILRGVGVDFAQGYAIGAPQPLSLN